MPEQPSEHAQPVEGERKEADKPTDDSRPEDGRDFWRAGQQEDLSAGDEGIDDASFGEPTLEDFRDDAMEAREADTEQDDVVADDAELQPAAVPIKDKAP